MQHSQTNDVCSCLPLISDLNEKGHRKYRSLDSQLAGLVVLCEEASYQHATVNAEVTKTETENDVSSFRELLIIGIRWYLKGEVVL